MMDDFLLVLGVAYFLVFIVLLIAVLIIKLLGLG